jgi:hypothetical protein
VVEARMSTLEKLNSSPIRVCAAVSLTNLDTKAQLV